MPIRLAEINDLKTVETFLLQHGRLGHFGAVDRNRIQSVLSGFFLEKYNAAEIVILEMNGEVISVAFLTKCLWGWLSSETPNEYDVKKVIIRPGIDEEVVIDTIQI